MAPEPVSIRDDYRGSGKLDGRVALISGGDSGIGRAVAIHFAREGANVAILYLEEDGDAEDTSRAVAAEGRECLLIKGDVADENFCREAVRRTVARFGSLDVLVNNAAQQYPVEDPGEISAEQLDQTFRVNVFGYMFLVPLNTLWRRQLIDGIRRSPFADVPAAMSSARRLPTPRAGFEALDAISS